MTHENKHTPAPWMVETTPIGHYIYTDDDYPIQVAKVRMRDYDKKGQRVTKEQDEANAQLIAAAPELLEALEKVLLAHDHDGALTTGNAVLSPAIHGMVKRTIAKARGTQ